MSTATPRAVGLRDVLGMTGTKFGCGRALCGACTVHVDGVATRSCITPIESVGSSAITTIEAVAAQPQRLDTGVNQRLGQFGPLFGRAAAPYVA